MRRIHVVDGTYELFRAHFSKRPPQRAPDGMDVKATAGVMLSLLAFVHDEAEAVTHFAVAFDNPIRSFRNDLFDGYKTEEGVPAELLAQFDLVEEAVRAIGGVVWSMKDHETDDALATAAARFEDEVDQVRIIASDKDLLQCVHGDKVVLVDRMRSRILDEAHVRKERGIAPESIPDLLALVGDTADGIPGLAGFGEKGAAHLLAKFGTIEAIPDDVAEWPKAIRGAERLAATLKECRKEVALYKKLATLVKDAPLPGTNKLDDMKYRGVPREAFATMCDRLGLTTAKTRPTRWAD